MRVVSLLYLTVILAGFWGTTTTTNALRTACSSSDSVDSQKEKKIIRINASWTDLHPGGTVRTYGIDSIPSPCNSDGAYLDTTGLFVMTVNNSQTLWKATSSGKEQLYLSSFKPLKPLGYGYFGGSNHKWIVGYRVLSEPPYPEGPLQLAAVDLASGEDVWNVTIDGYANFDLVAPRLVNGNIILVNGTGPDSRLVAYSANGYKSTPNRNVKPIWSKKLVDRHTFNFIVREVDVTSETVYVYFSNITAGFIAAYNVTNGDSLWLASSGGQGGFGHATAAGRCFADVPPNPPGVGVYVASTQAKTIIALNASNGNKVWEKKNLGSEPRHVYSTKVGPATLGQDGELWQQDGGTGKIIWSSSVGSEYHEQQNGLNSPCGHGVCSVMTYRPREGIESATTVFPSAFMSRFIGTRDGIEHIVVSDALAPQNEESSFYAITLFGWEGSALLLTNVLGESSLTLRYFEWEM